MLWLKLFCYLNMEAKCSDFFLCADSVVSNNLPNPDFSSYVVYPVHTLFLCISLQNFTLSMIIQAEIK